MKDIVEHLRKLTSDDFEEFKQAMKERENQGYSLVFNDDKQLFHLDSGSRLKYSYGWVTILESCTELDYKILESFINKRNYKRLTIEYVKACISELTTFKENLAEYGIVIQRDKSF